MKNEVFVKVLLLSTLVWIVFCSTPNLQANDNPIIFLHGHQSEGDASHGWQAWSNSNSAMMKIINQHYQDYTAGSPRDCDKTTQLQNMPDSRRIYNFSYYHSTGQRGVISLSEDSVLVYIKWVIDAVGHP